jgi:hypothetical protein
MRRTARMAIARKFLSAKLERDMELNFELDLELAWVIATGTRPGRSIN